MRRGGRALGIVCTGLLLAGLVTGIAWGGGTLSAFTEEAESRGLNFAMGPYPQVQGYVGQGGGFADLDNDGDPDVILIGRSSGQIGIFENIGGGFFVDHSATSSIAIMQQQEGFAAADYDGDGLLDLYITQAINRPNYLYKNNGNFTFTDATGTTGVHNGAQNSTGPTWGDFDNDGWLDLYVPIYGNNNWLYRNNGNGTFTNQAFTLGVTGTNSSLSFQTVWTDYDRDGDVDLYLSNDRGPLGFADNFLWQNDGGTFTDVSAASGANVSIYSMGIAAGDVDNNLYPDLYMTNVHTFENNGGAVDYDGLNPLLMNQTDGTFLDLTETWGTQNEATSWGAIFFDWDNDGKKDLYVNNQFLPNHFFHCDAVPCTEMAQALGIEASFDPEFDLFSDPQDLPEITSYNSAVADVDGDGDMDLMVNNLGDRAQLFINREGDKRSWVRYRIVGIHPNTHAIGAGVETTAGALAQFHEVYAGGNGYLGQNELTVHVGLDTATKADQTVVQWPSGGPTRTLTDLPAGEVWAIYPPSRLCDDDGDGVDYDAFLAFSACFVVGFSPGCEMMDFDGNSVIHADDLVDCFVSVPADCNGNGTEDLAEIMLDASLDADQDSDIDCCDAGPIREPNPVGDTVLAERTPASEASLSWTAPSPDASHDPATAYDVFGSTVVTASFGLHGSTASTAFVDGTPAPIVFYLVSARNGCGSSGEEPF